MSTCQSQIFIFLGSISRSKSGNVNMSTTPSNVDWWSFKTDIRDFSWTLSIVLFSVLDVNVQIRDQYEN